MPLFLTPDIGIHRYLERDRSDHTDETESVSSYRDYVSGKILPQISEEEKEILQRVLQRKFSDNICKQIVAEAESRITFRAWTCENKQVADFLNQLYTTARIEDRQGETHFDSLRDGNHAVAVAWDNVRKRVRLYREPWWDGTSGVFIGYDDNDDVLYAVKEWRLGEYGETIRRNIWFDDRLERWISANEGKDWEPHRLPMPGATAAVPEETVFEPWPLKRVKKDGSPLHIPIIHFPNSGEGWANYGTSELASGILGFQDQLNDLQLALVVAIKMTAFQMVWGTGISRIDPTTGEKVDITVGPGQFISSPNPDARFGAIGSGDISQMLLGYDKKLSRAAQVSRTPIYAITGGQWPSGEALLQANQPAIGKATRQIKKYTTCWVQVAHRAVELQNAYGTGAPSALAEDTDEALIHADFSPPERRDLSSRAAIAKMVEGIVSRAEQLRILGYSQDEIDRILEEKETEDEADAQRSFEAFSRGTGPGTELPGRGAGSTGDGGREPASNDEEGEG